MVQKQIDPRVQMAEMIQRANQIEGNQASGDLESRLNASKGGGSLLSEDVRGFMEPRFGADFSGVRVHTGSEAVQMNKELGAQAFAHGSDVYFGEGKSPGNNELTAHELTHVVQQGGSNDKCNQKINTQRRDSDNSQSEETLEQRLDRIEQRYRQMIREARNRGYDVAADNLERFLEGRGGTKTISVSWLRGFSKVTEAERENQSRFENSLNRIAPDLEDGQSRTFSDYWDRQLTASGSTELYYASGTSTIRSRGQFQLRRNGNVIRISGTVNHHWYDPYDWHAGLAAFIPGFGTISDEDALLLQQHRGAGEFHMEADWQQSLTGEYTVNDYWWDSKEYSWTGP